MTSSSTTETGYERLEFGVGTTAPDPDSLSVYRTDRLTIGGVDFDCSVIGSSHYITAPALEFHEIASCRRVELPETRTVSLLDGCSGAYRYDLGSVACDIRIETRPLGAYPADRAFDLHYTFEEGAVTAIDACSDGYETYHTYTEFDRTVYTRTRFDRFRE